ncbi:hypothetical protein COOONC_26332 [Cooperia oncophora]
MESAESVRVIARIRPSACDSERITYVLDVSNPSEPRNYAFEAVFDETIPQEQVYREVANHIVDGCVNGFNGTIFAYGEYTIPNHIPSTLRKLSYFRPNRLRKNLYNVRTSPSRQFYCKC